MSRGRKPKKAKNRKKPPARVTSPGRAKAAKREFGGLSLAAPGASLEEFLGSPDRRPQWWEPSYERLIAASAGLLAAQGPRVLEQATAELVGAELYRAVRDERTGLHLDAWATELIGRSVDWMADAAGRGDDAEAPGGCCTGWPPSGHTASALSPGSRRRRRRVRCRATFWPRSPPG